MQARVKQVLGQQRESEAGCLSEAGLPTAGLPMAPLSRFTCQGGSEADERPAEVPLQAGFSEPVVTPQQSFA